MLAKFSSTDTSTRRDSVIYTVMVEYYEQAGKPWSASAHREDGSNIGAVAGDSAHDVMGRVATLIDKDVAA